MELSYTPVPLIDMRENSSLAAICEKAPKRSFMSGVSEAKCHGARSWLSLSWTIRARTVAVILCDLHLALSRRFPAADGVGLA